MVAVTLAAGAVRLVALQRVPPGLHFDEAYNALDALKVLEGSRPVFFEGNFGREPLFVYLLSLAFVVISPTPAVIRAVAGLAGALAVPLTYAIGRLLHRGSIGPAVCAAVIQAFLPWDLHFSRYGLRVEFLPLLGNAAVLFLLLGWRRPRYRWFVAAGLCLGLALYGYMAARLLPLVFVAWLALALRGAEGPARPPLLVGFALAAVAAALVYAPLGWYFLTHPGSFTLRAGQVVLKGSLAEVAAQVADNCWLWLKAVVVSGDTNPRNNLPGAPALTLWLVVPWAWGSILSLRRLLRMEWGFPALWLGVMLLPSVLTDYAPSFQRAIGAVPPLVLITGVGLWSLAEAGGRLLRAKAAALALAALLLAGQTAQGLHQYFVRWGQSNALYYAFDEGIYQIAQYMRERTVAGEWVYLSPVRSDHATLHFVMRDVGGPATFDGREVSVLPPDDGRPVQYVFLTEEDTLGPRVIRRLYPDVRVGALFHDRVGQECALSLRAEGVAMLTPEVPVVARWAEGILLRGFDVHQERPGSRRFLFLMHWSSDAAIQQDYTCFLHVIGPFNPATESPLWSGSDTMPGQGSYPTSAWRPGETVIQPQCLVVLAELPDGDYFLEIGWYLWQTGERLLLDHPEPGQNRLLLGPFRVRDSALIGGPQL